MSFSSAQQTLTINDAWNIGMRRVNKIIEMEKAQGYIALATGLYSTIPDIIVFDLNNSSGSGFNVDGVIRVYEVTNYATTSEYVQLSRAERYRDTLLKFRAHKIFVCSFEENLRYLTGGRRFFEEQGIEVRFVGNQD